MLAQVELLGRSSTTAAHAAAAHDQPLPRRQGLLLRDRGYAETAPVAGHFAMDERNALVLTTDYETMSSLERFSFAGPDVRLRTSTVEGLSNTASFCVETRLEGASGSESSSSAVTASPPAAPLSPLGW